jgi:hypothetical protein
VPRFVRNHAGKTDQVAPCRWRRVEHHIASNVGLAPKPPK